MSRATRRRPIPAFSTDSLSSDDSHYLSHHPHAPPTAPLLPPRTHNMTPEPSLPPTTHRLAPRDRTLLMRSTRKLGQLLGSTPHVLELPPSSSPSHQPKLSRRTTLPHVQQVLLVPSNPPRVRRPSSASASSITSPTSPAPPLDPAPDVAAARRQKMDKLKRTLGENVPPELVFRRPDSAGAGTSVGLAARNALRGAKLPESDTPRFSLWKKASQGIPRKRSGPELESGRQAARSEERARTPPLRTLPSANERPAQSRASRRASTPPAPLTLSSTLSRSSSTSATQRAINVRRAHKMAQVFGTPPPHALYQITNTDGSDESLNNAKDLAKLAYLLDHDRNSLYDLLSTVRSPSPVDWPYEHRGSNTTSSPPPSPPISPTFNDRRRRAAKLARFFGVDYPRLYDRMLTWDADDDSDGEETETPSTSWSPSSEAHVLPSHSASSAPKRASKDTRRTSADKPRPSTSSSSTAREHRRSASLGLLVPDSDTTASVAFVDNLDGTSKPRTHVQRSFPPIANGTTSQPPPSPPPFFAFFPHDGENKNVEASEDMHDGIGGNADETPYGHSRQGSTSKVHTSATVHVQTGKSAGLKRVVSVSRDGRPKDDMQGVMSRLRELPGGR